MKIKLMIEIMNISVVIKRLFNIAFMYVCYITRSRKKRIVFFASFRGQYSDNPKAISEKLHQLDPSIQLAWQVSPHNKKYLPDYVTPLSRWWQVSKMQARANVWVLNSIYRKRSGIYKGSNIFYIQTWHGDRGIKTIGYLTDISKKEDYNGYDMSQCDLYVAASEYGAMKARKGFLYNGEVIMEGMPRNDKLTNIDLYKDDAVKIKQSLSIDLDMKILLYAPTFREGRSTQKCTIDISQTLHSLESNGEKWICLIRSHSLSKGIMFDKEPSCSMLDVSSYPDMADLLLISDLLITDYSSCAGDFILTNKPVVLAHFDRTEYQNSWRNLWIEPEEAGYLVAKNQMELNRILSALNSFDHKMIDEKIKNFYGTHETGNSSELLAKKILSVL